MTKKQVFIGIIILLVVGVAGFVGYKMYLNKKAKDNDSKATETKPLDAPAMIDEPIAPQVLPQLEVVPIAPQVLPQQEVVPMKVDATRIQQIKDRFQLLHDIVS